MTGHLDVIGQILVEMGDVSARVEARGDTITVELPGLRAGYAMLKRWPGGRGRSRAIGRIHGALEGAGLRLEVRIGPRVVALLGLGARAGLASRALGVAPMELKVDGLMASRRLRPAP